LFFTHTALLPWGYKLNPQSKTTALADYQLKTYGVFELWPICAAPQFFFSFALLKAFHKHGGLLIP
jgi:hypothetical protein